MDEAIKVPAIGFSTTINVDGNRQIVFQGYFEQDESDPTVNARIDRIMLLADRQRAKYSLPDLQAARDKIARELAQYEEDIATAEVEYKKTQAAIDVQILEYGKQREKVHNEGAAAHNARGGAGVYKPKGATAAGLANIEKALEVAADQKKHNDAERAQFLDNTRIAIERRQKELPLLDKQIADLERLFGH